ncbi:dimethylarginine dimethylaminohydrolase family protein [Edaphobacillus lindanitolerans]|uniref:N-Dimethylarginine dimethylaminohydrolase n=1 Tax=Edaphobacillus lindanitolerans TaxID=550447 RepID=A0A1U7PLC1_9BACI|nr:arginine deiminase family protein [Edaphobacillus lindanitolerans]SIT74768.1 N-Dimethylarginine dimethylaminohydrolase [Edaphobacillus lindanitolerans]
MHFLSSMYGPLERVVVKRPEQAFRSQPYLDDQWRTFNYVSAPDFEEAIREYEEFLGILEAHVPEIDFLPEAEEAGLDSLYAHDPVKFTPEGAIILKSGKALRQPEARIYKEYLEGKGIPVIGELTGDAVSDGGDIVWLDDRTIAVGRGYRTNDEAIRQLRRITEPYVDEFIEVQLPHDRGEAECLHLMSFLSLVDRDLAVVHSPLMPVFLRQRLLERGVRLIEVPADEYDRLGCNVLALAPRHVVLPSGNPVTKAALEEAGATVHEYKGDEITFKGTGGPTCLTCPVVRGR